jgi:hypothetical protein
MALLGYGPSKQLAEKVLLRRGTVPQLKRDSLQSIYVRPDARCGEVGRTLQKNEIQGLYGRAQEEVDAAEPAKPWDAVSPGSYVQGLAYLQLQDAGRALSAFQAATKAPTGSLSGQLPFYAQARLGLARAYAMGGDKANAKRRNRRFSPRGKTRMPICPCWWQQRRNTRFRRQERMASH